MHPVLFETPWGITINSYGTITLFCLWASVPGILWEARSRKLPKLFVVDFYLALIVASVVGGRLLFALLHLERYSNHPAQLFRLSDGGFAFHGSAGAAWLACLWLSRRYETPVASIWDILLTWGPLAHAIGRIGCLLAGCCYGICTRASWSISAHENPFASQNLIIAAHPELGIHPVQLYEAIGLLLIFFFQIGTRIRNGTDHPWLLTANWAICYGVLRFITEFFRADEAGEHIFNIYSPTISDWLLIPAEHPIMLSMAQIISLMLILIGALTRFKVARLSTHPNSAPSSRDSFESRPSALP